MTNKLNVYLEIGSRRTFAAALDWPGWCRMGRDEAAALQADLRRAKIEPFAWVINQSFVQADTRDPLLVARGMSEPHFINEVSLELSRRTAGVPWVREEPVGAEKLSQLFQA